MLDFRTCKTTKDFESVLRAGLRIYRIGKQEMTATGCPLKSLAQQVKKSYKQGFYMDFFDLETSSGKKERAIYPAYVANYSEIFKALEKGVFVHFKGIDCALWKTDRGNLGWRHFGSSANPYTLKDLKFVIKTIFNIKDLRKVKIYTSDSQWD